MSHWYIRKQLFDESHPEWETLEPWPRTKAGLRCKRLSWDDRIQAGLKPSVTTWLAAIEGDGVDGLMGFGAKIGRDVGMCMTDRWPYAMREEEYAKAYFWSEYRTRRDEYSKRGTRIHKVIEDYLAGKSIDNLTDIEAQAAMNARKFLEQHDIYEGGEAEQMIEAHDYAGMVDWHEPSRQIVVDWKTIRDEEGKAVRKPYPSELAQIAAYWRALYNEIDLARIQVDFLAANVYISQRTGKILRVQWWNKIDIAKGFGLFRLGQSVTETLRAIERKI